MKRLHRHRGGGCGYRSALLALLAFAFAAVPTAAEAATPPVLGAAWTTEVSAGSASFHGEVNPEGSSTTCHFEYVTEAHFQAEGFTGASVATCETNPGSGVAYVTISKHVSALRAATTYRYRLSATNEAETTLGPTLAFTTQEIGAAFTLPDNRGWELVSPVEKNGGAVQGFEANHGGGVVQAAASGEAAITYTSASSFGGGEAQGAPQASQYISRRSAAGWSTQNITTPLLSGSYGNSPNGVPYQLFSPDLATAILLNGRHCRGEGTGCPVANPPLSGTEAPAGYQNYYLRDEEDNGFAALLSEANDSALTLSSSQFGLALAGASPNLRHVILSTCAALTPGASEVAGTEGCDPAKPNLYQWSGGELSLINTSPGAQLAAQAGAVSEDGQRVYFTEAGKLWLREGSDPPRELAAGAEFQTATPTGALAFYTKAGDLERYDGATATSESIASGVKGVLGASESGSHVYYATAAGLYLWDEGTVTAVSATPGAAQPSDYPPTTGTARVSPNGASLLFLSKASLTGYDNTDQSTGQPDSEVFLYQAGSGTGTLTCLSCNPTGERPLGPSTIPGAVSNGSQANAATGEIVTDSYKPRDLTVGGERVFFDSDDALVALDTDNRPDVYQWEAQGTGSCQRAGGCLNLISSGTGTEGATFLDASESGEDAYFLTAASLVSSDPGSADIYDARSGGGFPEPKQPIPCDGDECAPLPSPPEDPTVGSLIPGPGNPPVHFPKVHHTCPKDKSAVTRHGKTGCVAKGHKRKHKGHGHKRHKRRLRRGGR